MMGVWVCAAHAGGIRPWPRSPPLTGGYTSANKPYSFPQCFSNDCLQASGNRSLDSGSGFLVLGMGWGPRICTSDISDPFGVDGCMSAGRAWLWSQLRWFTSWLCHLLVGWLCTWINFSMPQFTHPWNGAVWVCNSLNIMQSAWKVLQHKLK